MPRTVIVETPGCNVPTSAFSATIENDSYFALLFRFVVIPSTLFAGVFFPVSQLPALLRPLAYASPLWHAVELCRAATLGVAPPWPVAAHVAGDHQGPLGHDVAHDGAAFGDHGRRHAQPVGESAFRFISHGLTIIQWQTAHS
jgi:hypothetical protein